MLIELNINIKDTYNKVFISKYITKECFVNNMDVLKNKLDSTIISGREFVTYNFIKNHYNYNWNWEVLTANHIHSITLEDYNITFGYCNWNKTMIVDRFYTEDEIETIPDYLLSYASWITEEILEKYKDLKWDWNLLFKRGKVSSKFLYDNISYLEDKLSCEVSNIVYYSQV